MRINILKSKILKNASWIIGCRIIQSFLNLFVGMLSARYLGPSNYGMINYAAAIVSFFVPIMRLGFNATLVQDITNEPNRENEILGTALTCNVIASILCVISIIGFVSLKNRGDHTMIFVCAIYSLSLVFQAIEMIQYWFQAKLLSKYFSVTSLAAYIVVSVYKIYILVTRKSIYWFAFTNVIDYCLISVMLYILYKRISKQKMHCSMSIARKMFQKSKYYIFSSMMITVFQQTDCLMINNMLGNTYTGYYSAAVTCAGIFGFVYAAIIDSAKPIVFSSKKISQDKFEHNIKTLYAVIFYLSLVQAVISFALSKYIILALYGKEYLPAVKALCVSVWFVTYSYLGSVRHIWILAENKQKYLWINDVVGASVNVILNWCLIPVYGIVGAAIASFFTQFISNFVLGFFVPAIRKNNVLLIEGINPKYMMNEVKRWTK